MKIKRKIDKNFILIIFILITNFYLYTFTSKIIDSIYIQGISLEGYIRIFFMSIVILILLGNFRRYSLALSKERAITITILLLFLVMIIQIVTVDDVKLHLQGSMKYFLFLSSILVSLYSCYYYSDTVIKILPKIFIILFLTVFTIYPFAIYNSGLGLSQRLLLAKTVNINISIWGGNEDPHYMVVLLPFVLLKLKDKKLLSLIVMILTAIFLFYNGTRSAIISFILITLIFYFFTTRKFVNGIIIILTIFIISITFFKIASNLFLSEYGIFEKPQKVLSGEHVGGNFSGRIVYIWIPAIEYTLDHSPWLGFGSKGFYHVAKISGIYLRGKVRSPHNLFVWAFSTWGLIGLILIVYLYIKNTIISFKSIKKEKNNRTYSIAIFCSWIALIMWGMTANPHMTHGWTIFVLLILITISNKYSIGKQNNKFIKLTKMNKAVNGNRQ